jgi:hypothetical protein
MNFDHLGIVQGKQQSTSWFVTKSSYVMHCLWKWDTRPWDFGFVHKMPKGPIAYNKCHGILAMTTHVEQKHVSFKRFKEEQHACI